MAASQTFVDLSVYPKPNSDEFNLISTEEKERLEMYHILTEDATAIPADTKVISNAVCMENINGEACLGDIEVGRLQNPSQIRWRCLRCDNKGVITGFEKGESDLRHLSEKEKWDYLNEKHGYLTEEMQGLAEESSAFDMSRMPNNEEEFISWFIHLTHSEREDLIAGLDIDHEQINRRFEELTGGLDPDELNELLISNWDDDYGIVSLNSRLKTEELKDSIFFHNARTLLLYVQKEGRVELTKAGNLKRIQISELLETCIWPEGYVDEIKKHNKVINEDNVYLLHVARVMLEAAGLIRKHKGALIPVKQRAELSLQRKSGELYRRLFTIYFRKLNISYMCNSVFDFPHLQDSIPYMLYRLQELTGGWISGEELTDNILLHSARYELEYNEQKTYLAAEEMVCYLLYRPLNYFGLMESRYNEKRENAFRVPDEYRKTPLFDKFIQFRI